MERRPTLAWHIKDGRKILIGVGYAMALNRARADLEALNAEHTRNYAALCQELEALQREIVELRQMLGLRDPHARVH